MFSAYFPRIDQISYKVLLGVATVLVILCQLVAMALVADGQVSKAQLRDARYASERVAIAYCIESSSGVARNNCIQQVQAATHPSRDSGNHPDGSAVASNSGLKDGALSALQQSGFPPASFSVR